MLTLVRSLMSHVRKENGVETIEWIGLTVVVLMLLAAVAAFIPAGDATIGQAIIDVLESFIRSLSA